MQVVTLPIISIMYISNWKSVTPYIEKVGLGLSFMDDPYKYSCSAPGFGHAAITVYSICQRSHITFSCFCIIHRLAGHFFIQCGFLIAIVGHLHIFQRQARWVMSGPSNECTGVDLRLINAGPKMFKRIDLRYSIPDGASQQHTVQRQHS